MMFPLDCGHLSRLAGASMSKRQQASFSNLVATSTDVFVACFEPFHDAFHVMAVPGQ